MNQFYHFALLWRAFLALFPLRSLSDTCLEASPRTSALSTCRGTQPGDRPGELMEGLMLAQEGLREWLVRLVGGNPCAAPDGVQRAL